MNTPGELIDNLTLLIEHSSGVTQVDLGLFESSNRWVVLRLGERVLSGRPRPVSPEQIRQAMRQLDWPRLRKETD